MEAAFAKLISFFTHTGVRAEDSDEIRLQKALLVFSALMMSTLGVMWGLLYFLLGNPIAGAIPSSYAVLSYSSVALFAWSRRYQFFRASQLVLSLALPFLLMLSLGGFVNSSAVVLWSLTCPLGALAFAGRRQAILWFFAYLVLVFVSVFLDPWVAPRLPLPPWVVTVFFALNLTGVSVVAFVLLQYFVAQRDLSFGLLHLEQEKTEHLLLNILPREIAIQLKNQPGTIAHYYEEVTILFADLVGFTPLSATLPPTEMVGWLNDIFSYFDDLMDRYDVEKIETVGDEYMAACGVPRPCPQHAQQLAQVALEMCAYMERLPARNGQRLKLRIGLHSGPIVAGVIGRKKFAFECFGDTVNTAHRMQSHGVPGKIQITPATYEQIKDEFLCESRGKIAIKGKGEMETWILVGRKAAAAVSRLTS